MEDVKIRTLEFYDELINRTLSDSYTDSDGNPQDSILKRTMDTVLQLFNDYSLDNVTMGTILSELIAQTSVSFNKDAINGAVAMLQEERKTDLINEQKSLVKRQVQGFDDNLMVKATEHQSNLAAFAVNAGSSTAQTTIDDLKLRMTDMLNRVASVRKQIVTITLIKVEDTEVSIELVGDVDTVSFDVYQDDVLILTAVDGVQTITGLTADTKYFYTAVAVAADASRYGTSNPLVITTEPTP